MTAHDEARDPSREGPEHDGMDALTAALLDEPLPEGARRDPEFLAARDAALADLVVLREQLTVIADALAGPPDGAPAGRDAAARPGERPDTGSGPQRADAGTHAPGGAAPGHAETGPAPLRGLPSRRPRRRPVRAVLGGLAAAAAAALVLGTGWLVAQGGGGAGAADSGAAADAKEAGGVAFGSPRHLACARLVAEGAVTAVEQVPGAAGTERVTLRVSRYYKGEGEVTFLRDAVVEPPLRRGDRVLIGMLRDGDRPDMVLVGEEEIAPERARIIAALPESRTLSCGW
ncbi:hypothetical protein BU52_18075 [Streptomyces toyocaensis]|uniref:Uncharacterized protein n=1 Tax=Streptomyces toyocaensis TaxID=55952 RepID=A0A081XQ93_STRTO|nr:hypothetical protein [Streptomyces toyocaensis]KES05716.1 hypothetical protein BU52_18075 [Streptomyces toyocaensis]